MTKEKAREIIEAHGIGFTVDEFDEAVSVAFDTKVPQGLDEVAKEAGLEYAPIEPGETLDLSGQCYETDDVNWPSRCGFIQGFKAGAKWQLKNLKETCDIVNSDYLKMVEDEAFHRGAKWMAEQGVSVERTVDDFGDGASVKPVTEMELDSGSFCLGDEVIVQIRKVD